ncbi:MAG: hypothetical protein QM731_26335 [Chitinophagaceae bacterium]
MKQKKLILGALTVVVATVVGLVACKKGFNDKGDRALSAGALVDGCCGDPGSAGDSTISGVITSDIYLRNCIEYHLSGIVYVANNAKIIIQAGTRIEGDAGTAGTPGTPGGGLVITRGSQIIADGTPECPIVFTSYRWDGEPQSGDWAGIILLGKAPVNTGTPLIEGISGTPPADAHYGGDVCNDTSGILRYVRIEYAGYELSTDNEINGLTFGGVGCGTVVEHVEVYKSKDDAFEFFGGTVNCKWLVAVDALDDMFDTDLGYVGHIQFALGLSDLDRADKSQSNGIESDNNNIPPPSFASPYTRPEISNLTIVGPGCSLANNTTMPPSGTGSYGRGAHLRRLTAFRIANSVFMGFKWGVSLDGANVLAKLQNDTSCFCNNVIEACQTVFKGEGGVSDGWNSYLTCPYKGYLVTTTNDSVKLSDPYNRVSPDFALPQSGSPALHSNTGWSFSSSCFAGGCCSFSFTSTNYVGAFGTDNWAQDITYGGWVRYY